MMITLKAPAAWMIPISTNDNITTVWINAALIRRAAYNKATHKLEIEWQDGKKTYYSDSSADQIAKALNLCPGLNDISRSSGGNYKVREQ